MGRFHKAQSRSSATKGPWVKPNRRARRKATHSTAVSTKTNEPDNEEVGYGRPPKAHQFKPGQSGNPSGRRKGAKTEAAILREIVSRKVTIRQGDKARRIRPSCSRARKRHCAAT
jgi:Family of unknown function (DUF5681)